MSTALRSLRKPIRLFYAPTPNGWKITLLLEHARIVRGGAGAHTLAGAQHEPEFLKISPNGRIPAIVDPNFDDLPIFESGAILMHLADNYAPQFLPAEQRSRVIQWLFWMNANLGPNAGQVSHFNYYAPQLAPDADHSYARGRYKAEYERLVSVMDRELKESAFLGGCDSATVADFACWPWIKPWRRWMGSTLAEAGYEHTYRWYEAIKKAPETDAALAVLKEEARRAAQARIARHERRRARQHVQGAAGQPAVKNASAISARISRENLAVESFARAAACTQENLQQQCAASRAEEPDRAPPPSARTASSVASSRAAPACSSATALTHSKCVRRSARPTARCRSRCCTAASCRR